MVVVVVVVVRDVVVVVMVVEAAALGFSSADPQAVRARSAEAAEMTMRRRAVGRHDAANGPASGDLSGVSAMTASSSAR
ncbi:MAG: hypothetical protein HOV94_19690 [Saccharothrix sp.]|nr:hypothetical protein [Saccharothrix sp.]